ncbi:MAG TPA: hypothetical protein VND93_34595, partial [Myxococcales bacterium]|nr:hypothetical protein [Myxococcales bacterium]
VETTQQWSDILRRIEDKMGPFDPPLAKALSALKAKLPKADQKLNRRSLQVAADKLLKSSDEGAKQAGRAVSWALELRPQWDP